jgi:hypothetical protein
LLTANGLAFGAGTVFTLEQESELFEFQVLEVDYRHTDDEKFVKARSISLESGQTLVFKSQELEQAQNLRAVELESPSESLNF